MTTNTDIANRALDAIAARATITSLDDDQSAEAKIIRRWYATTRDDMLRAAPWSCATVMGRLTLQKSMPGTPTNPDSATTWDPATMPALPWLYQYAYPADCLFVRWVAPEFFATGSYQPFSVSLPQQFSSQRPAVSRFEIALGTDTLGSEATVVNTSAENALAKYVKRVETEDLWDAAFQTAMVLALASNICFAVSGSKEAKRFATQQAAAAIERARARDGNEGLTINDHIPDWLRVRGYAGDWTTTGAFPYAPWVTPSFLLP